MNTMHKLATQTLAALCFSLVTCGSAFSQNIDVVQPSTKLQPCGGDAPPGCWMLVLKGDPQAGASQRAYRFDAGFKFIKHWHSANENLVMTKGTLELSTDARSATLNPGDYLHIPAKVVHWGMCPVECEFYLMEDGPISFNVVEK